MASAGDSTAREQDGVLAHWRSICATPHQSGPLQKGDSRFIPQSPCMIPMRQRGPEVLVPMQPPEYGGIASTDGAFITVSLGDGKPEKKKKVPRRILHFSDGILEEYSTDEEEDVPEQPVVDPKTLTWLPWMWYYVSAVAYKSWSAADFCGEKLAWFFGITTPKYQSAIDEYYRRKEQEEKEKAEEERRLSNATLATELSASSIDVQVAQEDKVIVGDNVEKY